MQDEMQSIISKILRLYRPDFHFLKTLKVDYPHASGEFVLHENSYTSGPVQELSASNFIILMNQIVISTLSADLINKQIPELHDIDLTLEGVDTFALDIWVRKINFISYDKVIGKDDELTFTLEIKRVTNKLQTHQLVFFNTALSLSNGKHSGEVVYCYRPSKAL